MESRGYRGISYRLATVGVIIAFGLGLLLSTWQMLIDYQRQDAHLNELVDRVVEVAKPPATRAVHTLDDDLSSEVVDGILAYDFVIEVTIFDELGNILASGVKPRYSSATSLITSLLTEDTRVYQEKLEIPGYEDDTSGYLWFRVDLNETLSEFYGRSGFLILTGLLRNMVLVFLLFLAYNYMLTNPLIRMVREVKEIKATNPGESRVTIVNANRDDEITQLGLSVNALLEAISEAFEQRSKVESSLRQSEEAIRKIVFELPSMVAVCSLRGEIEFANPNMAELFGREYSNISGSSGISGLSIRNLNLNIDYSEIGFISDEDDASTFEPVDRVFEDYFITVEGKQLYLEGHSLPIVLNNETHLLIVINDVSERKEAEEKLHFMAYHDSLTNLPNRIYLIEQLEHELVRSRRLGYYGAVLFIDLDHFKNINDSLGHPVGDELLKQVSRRLKLIVREDDVVSRLSGDEFVVILTYLDTDMDAAALKAGEVAEKIRKHLSEPYPHQDINLHISCSIGIKVYSDGESSVYELLQFADTAMYQVKERGRNAIEFFNLGMADKVSRQLKIESELHTALEKGQFELFHQPKYDLRTNSIVGAESLIRWRHPERGLVSPGEFIPVLETSGLMFKVGTWVIEEACRTIKTLSDLNLWPEEMRLSVNISPRQFRQRNFVETIENIIEEVGVSGDNLDLEITEGVVIDSVEETIETLGLINRLGISISLDDFGTGYSSISYLKRLPVSTLKVDYSFVRDIVVDRNDRVLVETIITMGKLLDLRVVAEGVEQVEQLKILQGFGCHECQGYYFSPPIPLEEFKAALEKDQASEAGLV